MITLIVQYRSLLLELQYGCLNNDIVVETKTCDLSEEDVDETFSLLEAYRSIIVFDSQAI